MSQSYYEILGVPENSDTETIRESYRNLARKLHPDVNGGDDQAFKEVNAAYQVLSDPDRRAEYDQMRADNSSDPMGSCWIPPPFTHLFGSMHRQKVHQQTNTSIKIQIPFSFRELLNGCNKNIQFNRVSCCETCKGARGEYTTCSNCNGQGMIHQQNQPSSLIISPCPKCSGSGNVVTKPCVDCGGKGLLSELFSKNIECPPGMNVKPMVLEHEGNREFLALPRGDVIIVPTASDNLTGIKINGADVFMERDIDPVLLFLGGSLVIKTPFKEKLKVNIPGRSSSQRMLRTKGFGLPMKFGQTEPRGDFVLIAHPSFPNDLSAAEKELLEAYAASRAGESKAVDENKVTGDIGDA